MERKLPPLQRLGIGLAAQSLFETNTEKLRMHLTPQEETLFATGKVLQLIKEKYRDKDTARPLMIFLHIDEFPIPIKSCVDLEGILRMR